MSKSQSVAAATDVAEFLTDLDGGRLDTKLSVALSQVAAAVTDQDKAGQVTLKLSLKKVPGTCQVTVSHVLTYSKPTEAGKVSEEDKRATVMHVGKYGRLSIVPESQMPLLNQQGQPA